MKRIVSLLVSILLNSSLLFAISPTNSKHRVPPSVLVKWTETSPPKIIAGYNVYRSTISGGYYGKINEGLITMQSYIDKDVTSGELYYYVVTCVGTDGIESKFSIQVSALIK